MKDLDRPCANKACHNRILRIMSNPYCDSCAAAYHIGYMAGALDESRGLVTKELMSELRETYLPTRTESAS